MKKNYYRLKRQLTPFLFLLPGFLLFGAYLVFPFFYAFVMSLYRWGLDAIPRFAGFRNYVYILENNLFRQSVVNTIFYTCAVPFKILLALSLAILLNQKIRFEVAFRGILFFPHVLSSVVVGLIWQTMFNPNYGFINQVLNTIGLPGQRWLVEMDKAMYTLMVVSTWKGLGSNLIIFIAGIKNIPNEYYEAASIDGASGWQRIRFITLPCIKPTTIYVTTMTIIGAFKIFDLSMIMTQGGPGNATKTIVWFIFEAAFNRYQFGRASAAAFIFFIILFVLTVMQRRTLNAGEN
jgi:ABC-type sugar transport system permease subunit